MLPKARKSKILTYSDYCQWPENKRYELIEGEVFDMTPAPGTPHQEVCGNLFGILWTFFRGKHCKVFIAPFDIRLPKSNEEDGKVTTVVQPDIAVVCDSGKIDEKGCRGSPDFIVEVLSPSTSSKDHIKKRDLYERQGVREYWLIHPIDRVLIIYREAEDKKFGPAQIFAGEDMKIPVLLFPDLIVDFSQVFPPLPKFVRENPPKFKTKK